MEGLKGFFTKETAGLPNWAWLGVVLVGVGAGILFMRFQSSKSATPAETPTTASTDTTTGLAANADEQLGSSPVYVLATSPGDQTPPPPTQTPPPPPSTSTTLMIRQKTPKDPSSSTRTGIPFKDSPGGKDIASIPWGASVTTTGLAVSGPNNHPTAGDAHGSTSWYPITYNGKAGYISAYDIVGTGGGPDRYPTGLNSFFMQMEV